MDFSEGLADLGHVDAGLLLLSARTDLLNGRSAAPFSVDELSPRMVTGGG